jgi:carboxymethylenebutenolidase
MADEMRDSLGSDLSRREFVSLSVAASLAAAAGASAAAQAKVTETDVQVKTQDGTCDALLIHPASGSYPGVIVWPDAFGLRPAMRDIGTRLAADGYTVLVPNPYYRVSKAPGISMEGFSFQNADNMAALRKLMGGIGAAGAAERDAAAFVAFLDSQPSVNKAKKIGVQGYCMGGPLTFRTAAAVPDRIGAGGSFHGGGLVTQAADSPHTMIPKMKARLYVAVAANDDERQPEAKDVLKKAFADAKVPAEVEVYPSLHGWCVPDMPAEQGKPIYNQPDAEKAWAKLLALYKQALA